MPPKKAPGGKKKEEPADKLDPSEELTLQNMDLTTRGEEIYGRMKLLELENKRIKDKYVELKEEMRDLDTEFESSKDLQMKTQEKFAEKKQKFQAKIKHLDATLLQQQHNYESKIQQDKETFEHEINELTLDNAEMKAKIEEAEKFLREKNRYLQDIADLQKQLKDQKTKHLQEQNDAAREKIEATERLRKDMLKQIKLTKASLLAINEEQLQTTTRLTMHQNHQLTVELDYQSKQCEKLVKVNEEQAQKIVGLQRDVQIHKDVEHELAKRSQYCQKVIQKLRSRVKELEEGAMVSQSLQTLPADSRMNTPPKKLRNFLGTRSTRHSTTHNKSPGPDLSVTNEELINFLESRLETHEQSLEKKKDEYQQLSEEFGQLQNRYDTQRDRYKRAALLMSDFLESLLQNNPNILHGSTTNEGEQKLSLDLEKLRETKVEQWTDHEKSTLVLVLLKQLQPYLSQQTLEVSDLKDVKTPAFGALSPPPFALGHSYQSPQPHRRSYGGLPNLGLKKLVKKISVQRQSLPPLTGQLNSAR